MFCAQCGQVLTEGTKFCSHCGAPAPSAASPSSTSGPQPGVEPVPAPATTSAGAFPPLDSGAMRGLLDRIKAILLSPSTEWPRIAAEPATAGSIYIGYVAPLAAIGVIAGFVGHTLIGVSGVCSVLMPRADSSIRAAARPLTVGSAASIPLR